MQSKASTVKEYLASLSEDRRAAIRAVRDVILKNLDPEYEEGMQYGMIGFYVPHRVFPAGYHCDPKQPLPFVGMASQKNYMSVYMGCVYGSAGQETWFRQAWAKTGKKLDMGKSCIRFKKLDDLALDVIGEAVKRMPVKQYIANYEAALRTMGAGATRKAAAKPARTSKPTPKRASGGRTKPSAKSARA